MSSEIQAPRRMRDIDSSMIGNFRQIPVATIREAMQRLTVAAPGLLPRHAGGILCGPALTVRTRPEDSLLTQAALTLARAGDVIVIDAGGDVSCAIAGERMMEYAQLRGFAGVVVNGAIRDPEWCGRHALPVYAAGVARRCPCKAGMGEVNVPVMIDGMPCEPGDLVIGDADGLLIVPYDCIDAVYAAVCARLPTTTA